MSLELMTQRIEKAQSEIERMKDTVKKGKMRQNYHFMPQTGWMNDPNGLIFFKGKYHYFFQYNPYHGFWDYMHWGHAVSEDLIHWEYLPLALAPSEIYDDHQHGGCFSGSAIEHEGKLFLMFTGTTNEGKGFEQSQCIAYSEDGIHFEKYSGNPVLRAPEGIPTDFFRDPKVWKHENTYYMVCGGNRGGMAQALLYKSEDMFHWEFFNVLAESRGEWGYMWECPDFYPVGDKYVLMFSPMGAGERTSVYLVGDFDYKTGKFLYNISGEIDWGFDFYAPQSFLSEDGRRIIVGWANAWDWMPFWKDWGPTYKEGWCGFYNIPREVQLAEDNTLKFIPVKELHALRKDERTIRNVAVTEKIEISPADGTSYELLVELDLRKTTADKIHLELRSDGEKAAFLTFNFKNREMEFDRSASDGWSTGKTRSCLLLKDEITMKIHIYVDRSSIEVFTDDYQTNHSCNVFAGEEQNKNYIYAENGEVYIKELHAWSLKKVMDEA